MSITSLPVVTRVRRRFGSEPALAEGQDAGPILGYRYGVLPVCRTRPVDGSDCPLVVKHDGFTGSQRQHGFDGQNGALRRLLIDPTPGDVADAMCERFFEPTRDWKLFEIAVLLRIANALKNVGEPVGRSSMLVGGRSSFAQYKLSATKEIRLWYQMWPPESGPSELDDGVSHYQLKSAPTRPDIVVEFLANGVSDPLILLELKASADPRYLTEGLSQLLGYLRDRPQLTSSEAAGWLVAPPSDAYTTRPADGRSLWVVSSDAVAETLEEAVSDYGLAEVTA